MMDDLMGNIPDRWMGNEKLLVLKKQTNSEMVMITYEWADTWLCKKKCDNSLTTP